MLQHDPRVDAYITKAPDYAKPILLKLRRLIHEADGELAEEIKWGAPTFVKHGLVCSFHAFKNHVAVWFHKGALLRDPKRVLNVAATVSMRAAHFQEPADVATPAMRALVKQAVKLNAAGAKARRRTMAKATGAKKPGRAPSSTRARPKTAASSGRRPAEKQEARAPARARRTAGPTRTRPPSANSR